MCADGSSHGVGSPYSGYLLGPFFLTEFRRAAPREARVAARPNESFCTYRGVLASVTLVWVGVMEGSA
jgi:hypothetical protein